VILSYSGLPLVILSCSRTVTNCRQIQAYTTRRAEELDPTPFGAIRFQGGPQNHLSLLSRESHGRESNPTQGATPVPMHTLPTRTVRPSCDSRRAEYLKPMPFGTISFRSCPQNPLSLLSIYEPVLRELNPVSLCHNLGSARLYQLA
jgi:hypothetical protein